MGIRNSKLSVNLKPYVGKVFLLRNRKTIVGSYHGFKDGSPRVELDRSEFGEGVFIIDESNTRVCCFNKSKRLIWIPKLYLLKEITSEKTTAQSVSDVLEKMITIYSAISESNIDSKEQVIKECEHIISELKLLVEKNDKQT